MTIFDLSAALLYTILAAVCLGVAAEGRARRAPRGGPVCAGWALAGGFLLCLAIWRAVGAEPQIEAVFREAITHRAGYEGRYAYQKPLVAILFTAGIAVVIALVAGGHGRLVRRFGPQLVLAAYGVIALVGLVLLRLVSYHATDALLYSGPHLNRVLEPTLAAFIAFQALAWRRTLGTPAKSRRERRRR